MANKYFHAEYLSEIRNQYSKMICQLLLLAINQFFEDNGPISKIF